MQQADDSAKQRQDVERNGAEAVKWYKQSADQGDAFAQYNLGVMYGDYFMKNLNEHQLEGHLDIRCFFR